MSQATAAPASSSTPPTHTECSCSPAPPLPAAFAAKTPRTEGEGNDDDDTDDAAAGPSEVASKWAALLGSGAVAAAEKPAVPKELQFEHARHVQFFSMHVKSIPQGYESLDTSRVTLLYFCLSALDVLGALDSTIISKGSAPAIIDWLYSLQVHPYTDPATGEVHVTRCGFRGGTFFGVPFEPHRTTGHAPSTYPQDMANLAMTYSALCCLKILGDDLSRVNRSAIIGALKHLQQADGSFSSTAQRSEADMRFLYCACAVSAMLADWSGFDTERSIEFVRLSQAYDGGIGMQPGQEGHGGSTYVGVASLVLMNAFHRLPSTSSLLKWLIHSQGNLPTDGDADGAGGGYRGRPNKPSDSCYSFWVAAALRLAAREMDIDLHEGLSESPSDSWTARSANRRFNLRCQSRYGGFQKEPGALHPDLLHAYMGLCGIGFIGLRGDQAQEVEPLLGLTHRAAAVGRANQKRDGTW